MITLPDGLGKAEDILKRFSTASARRELWRSILQDMYDFCIPNRETFNFHNPGQRKARHLFDATAPESVNTFVSVVTGTTTPSDAQWMDYEAGSDIPEGEKKDLNKKLEEATKIFFEELNLSEYASQVNTSHQDMTISTGCLMIEEGDGITEPFLKFTAIPLPELYLEPTSMSRVHTFFRKHNIVAQEIMLKFPEAKLSDKLKDKIDNSPAKDIEVIDGSQVFNFKTKTYHQIVIIDKEVIFEQDYGDTPPGVVYRWSKVGGETYGRGPVDMVMADIRTVNAVKRDELKMSALKVSPPLMGVSDGIFNPHTAVIAPGAVMPVRNIDSLKVLDLGGDLRSGAFVIEDLQSNIRKGLFADPVGEFDDPVQSATFNAIKDREMLKKRGANFGRLNTEFIIPFVARATQILVKAGRLPKIKVDGKDVTLKIKSATATSEQQANVDNVLIYMNALSGIPEEDARIGAKTEAIPAFLVKNLNLPEELARSKDEIETIKKQLLEQAQQQPAPGAQPNV